MQQLASLRSSESLKTMAAWTASARHVSIVARFSSSKPSSLVPRRGMSDHHGPPRVNIWEDPMSPSKWKEEHFVIASLSVWGLLFYGGYKLFSGGKGKKEEKVGATPLLQVTTSANKIRLFWQF